MAQDRPITDTELRKLMDDPKADLSLLTTEEAHRLAKLTDPHPVQTETDDPGTAYRASLLKTAGDTGSSFLHTLHGFVSPSARIEAAKAQAAADEQTVADARKPQHLSLSNVGPNVKSQVDDLKSLSDPKVGGAAIAQLSTGLLPEALSLGKRFAVDPVATRIPDALVKTGDVLDTLGAKGRKPVSVAGGVVGAYTALTGGTPASGLAIAAIPYGMQVAGKGMRLLGRSMGGGQVPEEFQSRPGFPRGNTTPPPSAADLQAIQDRITAPDPPDSSNARGGQGPAPSEAELQVIRDRMATPDPPDSPNAQGSRGPEPPEGYGGYRPPSAVDSMEAALLQQKFDDAMSKRNLSYADEQIAAKANADRLRTIEAAKAGLVSGDPGISETTGATRPDGSKVSLRQSYGSPKPPKAPQAAVVPTSPPQTQGAPPVAAAPPEAPMVEQMVAPEGVKPPTPAIDPEAQAIRDQTATRPDDLPDPVGPVKEDPMVDELVKPKEDVPASPLPESWKALEKPQADDPWKASVAKKTGRHSDNTIDAAVDWALKNPGKTKVEVATEMAVQKGMRHVIRHETPRAAKGLRVISDVARDTFKSLGYSDEDLAYMTPEQAAKKMQVELDKRNGG